MIKLYLNMIMPGILIGFLLPASGKMACLKGGNEEKTAASSILDAPAGLLPEASESVCGELFLEPGNPKGILLLSAFDRAKGRLTRIHITTEGTLLAEINHNHIRGNNYSALLSADWTCTLPSDLQLSQTANLTYQASINSDRQMESGIATIANEPSTDSREVHESLERFYGSGILIIPLEVRNLINLKRENFNYRTRLKAKICIDYFYTAN